MKRLFSLMVCIALLISGTEGVVFADEIVVENSSKSNLIICSDEGIEKLLNSNSNEINTLRNNNKDKTDVIFSRGKKDKDNNKEIITMEGAFEYNGEEYLVEAEGYTKVYHSKIIGKIITGHLKGKIYIGENEREINVAYEENKNNLYYSITINNLGNDEGFAVFTFGESSMNESVLKELGLLKDDKEIEFTEDDESIINPMAYDPIRGRWVPIDEYGGLIVYGRIFLEDDITSLGRSGKMMFKTQVDKNEAKQVINDGLYFSSVAGLFVHEFELYFDSFDRESTFGAHSPDENDSRGTVFRTILSAIKAIPKVPSSLIDIIELIGTGIGNDIVVNYDNDMYRRRFYISPDDDIYMDWYEYRSGGYPVEIFINKDSNAYSDRISVDFNAVLAVYLRNMDMFLIGSDTGYVEVDLSRY